MSILSTIKNALPNFHHDHVTLKLDDIQAIILRSRPVPYVGTHAMLHVDEAAGGRDLLKRLAPHIGSAGNWTEDADAWVGMGISFEGLKALGVPASSLNTFPMAFQQGMAARAEILRDTDGNAPEHWDESLKPGVCHIALTIYARDEAARDKAEALAMAELKKGTGVTLLGTLRFGADADGKNPFGYRDSISQPTVAGSGIKAQPGQERHIAAGEFILGEVSENGQALGVPQPSVLGLNGSYAVFRKYISHVGAFNDFTRQKGEIVGSADLLGAKMFGRWRSGAPLVLSPDHDDPELGADPERNNDFDFSKDKLGLTCPFASHMRRNNPRDSALTILTDVNIHRIIRRSSTFGPKWSADVTSADDAKQDRGIVFIFISARAFDTIEFAQQEWINRGNFIDLGEERDPVVGVHTNTHQFTVPSEPARHRIDGVTTFNTMKGGEYMFMPSLSGLRWLAEGQW